MTSQHSLRPLLGALLTSALVAFPVFAGAQELAPAHVDPATELRFPKKLSQLRFERVVEFPTKQLGYCVVYSATTAFGQVCVYDLGHQNLPTGVESKEFNAALNIAVDGMLKAASTPPYRKWHINQQRHAFDRGGWKSDQSGNEDLHVRIDASR